MASVFGRAREAAKKSLGSGNWIDSQKDDLIRAQAVFGITDVRFDESGQFGERWVVTLTPWYDGDESPDGDLSFKATPYRDTLFGEIGKELDRLESAGEDVIVGPCVLVKSKTANGKNRFYDIVEWDEEAGAPVGAAAEPEPEPEPRGDSRRSRPTRGRGRPQAEPEEEGPRPTQRSQRASRGSRPSQGDAPRGRGRPAQTQAPEPDGEGEGEGEGEPEPAAQTRQRTRAAAVPAARQAAAGATLPNGGGQAAQEIVFQPGKQGVAMCLACAQDESGQHEAEITGRMFPHEDGRPVILHKCPVSKKTEVLDAQPLEEAS